MTYILIFYIICVISCGAFSYLNLKSYRETYGYIYLHKLIILLFCTIIPLTNTLYTFFNIIAYCCDIRIFKKEGTRR